MEEIRKVLFCPHCGNRAPQKLVYSHECWTRDWISLEEGEEDQELAIPTAYFVAICDTCEGILLYGSVGETPPGELFHESELMWPQSGKLHKSVPTPIADIYYEANVIKNLAPNAFAGQIRRALEALCEDRGAKKGVLQQRLNDLAAKGEIPKTLAEVSDVLRLLGNIGVHAAEDSVKPWQVNSIDEFFRAVVEYVYVAPSKLNEFKNSLKSFESKSKKDAKSDSA